jgi:hypothetical protein
LKKKQIVTREDIWAAEICTRLRSQTSAGPKGEEQFNGRAIIEDITSEELLDLIFRLYCEFISRHRKSSTIKSKFIAKPNFPSTHPR